MRRMSSEHAVSGRAALIFVGATHPTGAEWFLDL